MNEQQVINFNINDQRIAEVAEEFKEIDAYKDVESAKQAKKVLVKMRSVLTDAHKDQKAEALRTGQRLDAEKRRLLALIAPIEDPITEQLDEIKNTEAKKEQERIDRIQARIKVIRDYGLDLEDLEVVDLQRVQERLNSVELDSSFEELLVDAEGAKAESESRLRIAINRAMARKEEEAKLEQQRKDQGEQQLKLDKQKAEADERDRKAREAEEERKRIELEERDRKLVEDKRILDQQRLEQDEKERKEREAKATEEADKLAAKQAPDVDKLLVLATDLTAIPMPTMKSRKGSNVIAHVEDSLNDIVNTIRKHAGEMQ